jgi:hypothetical protein
LLELEVLLEEEFDGIQEKGDMDGRNDPILDELFRVFRGGGQVAIPQDGAEEVRVPDGPDPVWIASS